MFDGGDFVSEQDPVVPSARRRPGGPRLNIDDDVRAMVEQGCHAKAIALVLGVSPPTVSRRIRELGLEARKGNGKGLGELVPALVLKGLTIAKISEAVDCHPSSVMHWRRKMKDAGIDVPVSRPGPAIRRTLFEARWPGRNLLPRRFQRRRLVQVRAAAMGHAPWESGVASEELFVGASLRQEQEHILHRIGTVDDTSDDWRSEVA